MGRRVIASAIPACETPAACRTDSFASVVRTNANVPTPCRKDNTIATLAVELGCSSVKIEIPHRSYTPPLLESPGQKPPSFSDPSCSAQHGPVLGWRWLQHTGSTDALLASEGALSTMTQLPRTPSTAAATPVAVMTPQRASLP